MPQRSTGFEPSQEVWGWDLTNLTPDGRLVMENVSFLRPVVAITRQSPEKSMNVFEAVAEDCHQLWAVMAIKLGIDCRAVVPDKSVLINALAESTDHVDSIEFKTGRPFRNTFATLDLRPAGTPIVIFMCAGTSHKFDQWKRQPFQERLGQIIDEFNPALLFSKTSSRTTRTGWGQAPVRVSIDQARKSGLFVAVGSEDGFETDPGTNGETQVFSTGLRHQETAASIVTDTRRYMVSWTKDRMENGFVDYALGAGVPPGFTRITLRQSRGLGRVKRVYLDSPTVWPKQVDAHSILPCVVDRDGNEADQVQNIRWFLAHAGKSPWRNKTSLAIEMGRRGYSTDALRTRSGHSANYDRPVNHWTKQIIDSILHNLEVYETGELSLDPGHGEVITVTNAFPADGAPWANEDDFDRIRAWMAEGQDAWAKRGSYTFSRLPLTFEGRNYRLAPVPRSDLPEGEQGLVYCCVSTTPVEGTTARSPRISHDWIAESILEAVIRSGRAPLNDSGPDAVDSDLENAVSAAEHHRTLLSALRTTAAGLYNSATEVDSDGTFVAPMRTRRQLWADHEAMLAKIDQSDATQKTLDAAAAQARLRSARARRGLEVTSLLDVLVSLRDGSDLTYQAAWRTAIYDFELGWERVNPSDFRGMRVFWSMKIRLSDDQLRADLVVTGERVTGAASTVKANVEALLDGLRDGVPVHAWPPRMNTLIPAAAAALNLPTLSRSALRCPDPLLVKLHMRIIDVERGASDETLDDVAADPMFVEFGNVAALVGRIREKFHSSESKRQVWAHIAPVDAAALIEARANEGWVRSKRTVATIRNACRLRFADRQLEWDRDLGRGQVRLIPCRNCGSYHRYASRAWEMSGYVCAECRQDREGVIWGERFNEVLGPDAPVLGYALLGPAPVPERRPASTRRNFVKLSEISAEQRQALIDDYLASVEGIRPVAARHNLSYPAARKIVADAGATKSRPHRPHNYSDMIQPNG